MNFDVHTYRVIHGGLEGARGRIIEDGPRAFIRLRGTPPDERPDDTVDYLLKKAERGELTSLAEAMDGLDSDAIQ